MSDSSLAVTVPMLTAAGAAGGLLWHHLSRENDRDAPQKGERSRIINSGVSLIALCLWPVLWNYAIGWDYIKIVPWSAVAFLWPMVMILWQIRSSGLRTNQAPKPPMARSAFSDSSTLISSAFAMGTLLVVGHANAADKQNHAKIKKYIMYALVLCVAFIVPTSHFAPDYQVAAATRAGQRAIFNYAMGFLLLSIIMYVSTN